MNRPLHRVVLALLFAAPWLTPVAVPAQPIASWKLPIPIVDELYSDRLYATAGTLTLEEHVGPLHGKPTRGTRQTVAFAAIGCIAGPSDDIQIYPAKRWGVASTDLRTGKTSPDAEITLAFPASKQGESVLSALEAARPSLRSKVGACKSDVDLYHLQFGAIPASSGAFTWVRNSMLGATPYAIWVAAGFLYVKEADPELPVEYYKLPLTDVGCLRADPETKRLASSVLIRAVHPRAVLDEELAKPKPTLFTRSTISLTFDNDIVQQDVVQYLQDKSTVFTKKLGGC
jgi:hypothetical protein